MMIKGTKKAIYVVLGEPNITNEESLLNSRLITYQTAHPCDKTPLTPNHFLYGQVEGIFAPDSVNKREF